jgi:hypothetical protein
MKVILALVAAISFSALSGCVVVPARGYVVGPRVAIVAPAPYVAVRPYYGYGPR